MKTVITAEEIQKDLLSSQEAQTSSAIEVLKKDASSNSRAERLSKLGFKATPAVMQYEHAKMLVDCQQECERLYPGLKFISNTAMHNICEKYDLIIDEVSQYVGDVPDWAIDVIERSGVANNKWYVQIAAPIDEQPQTAYDTKEEAETALAQLSVAGLTYSKSNLHIAAPTKDMLGSYRSYRSYRVSPPSSSLNNWLVNDPIVCVPVNGGYAVVCAWGEEGKDPMVFNPGNN